MNADQLSRFQHDHTCRFITYRENAIIWFIAFLMGIFTKPVGNLLRNEYDFVIFTALGGLEDQFLILKVFRSECQHLSDPHPATGHQFEQ